MKTPTITHLSLFRKYGGNIMTAHPQEMKAAARSVPEGQSPLTALFTAAREYEKEEHQKYQRTGIMPAVCFNRDNLCEDDHCRCWK